MGVFLIILLLLLILWPWISPYVTRWIRMFMARRAEDMMRRMMGMPSRKEERRRARAASAGNPRGASSGTAQRARRHRAPRQDAARMLRSVAEDVEFTEIREFDSAPVAGENDAPRHTYNEEQVSDVEFTEIKDRP